MELSWNTETTPAEADMQVVADEVASFGRSRSGSHAKPLACFVRTPDRLIGGATGRTELDRLFVQYLWVEASYRRKGIGTRLLQMLEAAAVEQGCHDALIETLLDENAALYARVGYGPLALVPNYVGTFTKHVLVKRIA